VVRYDIQFQFSAEENPDKDMHQAILAYLRELKEADNRLVIYPWKSTDGLGAKPNLPVIRNLDKLPTTLNGLRGYLPGLRQLRQSGKVYSSACLGMDKTLDQVRTTAGSWLKSNDSGLYIQQIQAEQTYTVGWLLYSIQSMDTQALQTALEKHVGISVHARWQMINTGHNRDLKDSEKIKALHLKVDSDL